MIGEGKEDLDFPNHIPLDSRNPAMGPKTDCSNRDLCITSLLRRGVRYTQYHTGIVSLEKSKECGV